MRNEVVYSDCTTQTIELNSDSSLLQLQNKTFSAVNVTLHVWEKLGFYIFAFLPIQTWIDLRELCSPLKPEFPGFAQRHCPYNSSCSNETTLRISSNPVDISRYWLDRSVVVFNLASVNIPNKDPCLRMSACGLNRCEDRTVIKSSTRYGVYKYPDRPPCHPQFGYLSTHCKEKTSDHAANSSTFLASQTLVVSIYPSTLSDFNFSANLSFVASIGYRLMPGVFECPKGMFLCRPPSTCSVADSSGACFEDRICLPNSLRCDNHSNCPGTSWDEENCSSNPPMSWQPVQDTGEREKMAEREIALVTGTLRSLSAEQLQLAGYRQAPIVYSGGVSHLLVSVFIFGCMVSTCLLCFFCMRQRRHKDSRADEETREAHGTTQVQPFWPPNESENAAFAPLITMNSVSGRDHSPAYSRLQPPLDRGKAEAVIPDEQ